MALAPKAVKSSGAVSPAAIATPRITAVTRPERGREDDLAHRSPLRRAEAARDASRSPPGTTRSTSSVVLVMDGSISTNSASAARSPSSP